MKSLVTRPSDPAALSESLDEAVQMINRARQPVILADVEVHRFGLQELPSGFPHRAAHAGEIKAPAECPFFYIHQSRGRANQRLVFKRLEGHREV
jgi:hypothetical protein